MTSSSTWYLPWKSFLHGMMVSSDVMAGWATLSISYRTAPCEAVCYRRGQQGQPPRSSLLLVTLALMASTDCAIMTSLAVRLLQ
jgi:hypothetical protein